MISVIIPLFNAEKTIVAALESVLNQTFGLENFEIFVINDGSTDSSKNLVETFINKNPEAKISFLHQENKGVSAARNAGLKICNGEYIAFLDADDIWFPEKTSKQMDVFTENLEIDFLSCRRTNHTIKYPYKVGKNNLAEITFRKLLFRNETQPSTVIFKRKILENTGYLNDNQRYAEDVNYWLRISEKNKMSFLNEELVIANGGKRTFGVSGLSANLKEMHLGFLKNLKEMYYQKRISFLEWIFYFIFYKIKFLVLQIRNF
ncbi:glycosyltransferase family 2 protein [Frigoriflavimonas asaccharolytica]|uniref:Glycosyltransferase involved in cell wall biosynthesis n=1 Tax=Frigoriflavimonas asaccharolytica TaxID=2735899 RepID=A0A8J8K7E2_9FLAO|nr:glycosyltransferase family A protein [Frigoriflavimonas asaccharolytica]NRS91396.1 glycosyltransferase involved in cell wall biosynthesis [Frigoriflavimonas asaccharolytica]